MTMEADVYYDDLGKDMRVEPIPAEMQELAALREKYDLHMRVERFVSDDREDDEKFIRK